MKKTLAQQLELEFEFDLFQKIKDENNILPEKNLPESKDDGEPYDAWADIGYERRPKRRA